MFRLKRLWNTISAVAGFMIAFLVVLLFPQKITAQELPNIITILVDDAGWGDVGVYGQTGFATPRIDQMAREGLRFTAHYAGSPVCAPSRSSLLTGQHTGHTPIRGNHEFLPEGQRPLPEDTLTLGRMLQDAGMRTAVIGKWGLGGPGSEGVPTNQGFDEYFTYLCQREAHTYYPDHLWRNDVRVELDGETWTHDLFTEDALRFVRENRDNPFFLYLTWTIPHAALEVPDTEPYADRDWPEPKKKFAAMMGRLDSDVGLLLDTLRQEGLAENTLVLFTSDNGPHNEGGADPAFFNSAGPFRGMKRDLYEGGIRIPMIAWWPGTVPAGEVTGHISAFWDWMPTFAELTGLPVPEQTDGISLVPLLTGRPEEQAAHDSLYWEFHEQGGRQAIRQGDWKAVRHNLRLRPDGPVELYNLMEDPGETRNLAGESPERAAELAALMAASRTPSEEFPLMGKNRWGFDVYGAWPYPVVFAAVTLLGWGISRKGSGKRRRAERRRTVRLHPWTAAAAAVLTAALMVLGSLSAMVWGTLWMTAGNILAVGGIVFYGLGLLAPALLPAEGHRSLKRGAVISEEAGFILFWTGQVLISVTLPVLLLIPAASFCRFKLKIAGKTAGIREKSRPAAESV